MLREISIRQFAIIEQVQITFDEGFHVLTGETGAGKSILIDALGLIVGGRGSSEWIRHGAKKAEIEALFEITPNHPIRRKLEELGIEVEDDLLLIRRELLQSGKSVCRINGRMVTQGMLKQVGVHLIDIHGQHEHQSLMQAEQHIEWLDAFGGEELLKVRQHYEEQFTQFRALHQELERLVTDERELAQRVDLLQFQHEEITAASLVEGEDEELEQEHRKLAHAERIVQETAAAYEAIQGEQRGFDSLGEAVHRLQELTSYDESLKPIVEILQSAYYQVDEVLHQLGRYQEELVFEPARLAEVEQRLDLIHQLKRKYGDTVAAILAHGQEVEKELNQLMHQEERQEEIEAELAILRTQLEESATKLSQLRRQAATTLEERVEAELRDLNMETTRFQVSFSPVTEGFDGFTATGKDKIEFLIAPNPGEPPRPLVRIASGGELSRIMLALKSLFSAVDQVETLVFDEIDTGVSGRAAQAIAEKMSFLAKRCQVLCVTHLPQVACMADVHFQIFKETDGQKTRTRVKHLTEEGATLELARMLGGVEVTETTREHAREMLRMAVMIKSTNPNSSH